MSSKTTLFRRWYFWALLSLISFGCGYFNWFYLPSIYPLLTIPIADKAQVEKLAHDVSKQYHLGPETYFQISHFVTDQNVENYIEQHLIKIKNKESIQRYIQKNSHHIYTWQVRHFKEADPHECLLKFTPEGIPYGFIEHISETEPGPSLTQEEALTIANDYTINWNINLNDYNLVESSHQERPNGRTDYTFLFEHKSNNLTNPSRFILNSNNEDTIADLSAIINALKYKLVVCVYGNKVTTIDPFIEISANVLINHNENMIEEFNIANENLNAFTSMLAYFIYIIICLIGFIILVKKNYLIKNAAIYGGIILAIAQFVYQLSTLSDIWLNYNTSQSAGAYLVNNVLGYAIGILFYSLLYSIIIMIGEGLTRVAFPGQVQVWKLLNKEVTSSFSISGLMVGSYLLVPLYLALILALSLYSPQLFGWCYVRLLPIEPTIVGHYYPALAVLAQTLYESSWKELLFRAIPIACFAIIGQKIGIRKIGLFIGFLAQLILTGIINFPYLSLATPIKFIEPIISSFFFGLLYINFGLIPGILMQFINNVIILSLPLFKINSAEAFIQKILLVIGIFIPIILLFINIVRNRTIATLSEKYLNATWTPRSIISSEKQNDPIPPFKLTASKIVSLMILTSLSISLLYNTTKNLPVYKPHFTLTREDAIQKARDFMASKDLELDSSWEVLSKIITPKKSVIKYIWQNFGEEIYKKLHGMYIAYPLFEIKFTKFEGTHCLRAEEYTIRIDASGKVESFQHILREDAPGQSLTENVANQLALSVASEQFKLDPTTLEILSTVEIKRPLRKDWIITIQDKTVNFIGDAQAHIVLEISGDEITSINPKIYLPPEWLISKSKTDQFARVFELFNELIIFFIILIALFQAFSIQKSISIIWKSMLVWLTYLSLIIIDILLRIPEATAHVNTAKSFYFQMMYTECMTLIIAIVKSVSIFLFAVNLFYTQNKVSPSLRPFNIINISLGIIASGLTTAFFLLYKNMPISYSLDHLNTYDPTLSFILSQIINFLSLSLTILFLTHYAKFSFSARTIFAITAATLLITSSLEMKDLYSHLLIFLIIFVVLLISYLTIIRYNPLLIPFILFTLQINQLIQEFIADPFVHSKDMILITIFILSILALIITLFMHKSQNKNYKKHSLMTS